MKKFIVPALISVVVLLTSCSKALYKDKYDWVKVAPSAKHETRTDSVVRKAETLASKSAPEIAIESIEAIAANLSDSARTANGNHAQEVVAVYTNGEERATVDSTASERSSLTNTLNAAKQNHASKKERKALRRNSSGSDIDWLEVGWSLAGLVGTILIIVYWDTPAVQVALLIWQIIEAIIGIVAIGLMIYGICWFFGQFLFMMDN